ncbi:hypothetical protein [Thermococcus peptonophilus]|nr:hypothetical protein [Thermococcus peptonophilus]
MKWELTLYGGEHHGKTLVVEAENVEEARRIALREARRKDALTYELAKIE